MGDAPDPRVIQLYNDGAGHFKKGDLDGAIESFRKCTEADKEFYRAWAYLGMAYAQKGELDPAIEAYRECIDIAPTYHKAFNNIGELYRRKGLLDYAAMVFKMATEIEPTLPHYFYNLGITYHEIGMFPQAEEALASAVRLDPRDLDYVSELAQVRFTLKKFDAAIEPLDLFLRNAPDHDRAPELRARVNMLKRLAENQRAAAESMGQHTTGVRRASLDDDEDEAGKTRVAETEPESPPEPAE